MEVKMLLVSLSEWIHVNYITRETINPFLKKLQINMVPNFINTSSSHCDFVFSWRLQLIRNVLCYLPDITYWGSSVTDSETVSS